MVPSKEDDGERSAAEQSPMVDRHIRVTRTWFLFFSVWLWQYCMQVNICLSSAITILWTIVVSAVLVRTEHARGFESRKGSTRTLRRHRAGMPPVASGQTGTASLAVQRPTDCTTVAPVAGISVGPHGAGAPAPPAADGHPAMLLPPAPRQGIRTSPLHSSGNRETRTRR